MTVGINIRPELEERLAVRDRFIGLSLENFVQDVLERETAIPETNGSYFPNWR